MDVAEVSRLQGPEKGFGNRFLLDRHASAVENHFEIWMSDLLDELNGFRHRVDEVGVRMGKRLDAVENISFLSRLQAHPESFLGEIPRLLFVPPLPDRSLMWRTMNQNLSSDVSAEVDECLDVFLSLDPDDFIGMVDVEPFWFRQQPMEADDFDPHFFRCLSNRFSPLRGDFSDGVCQGVGGDLNSVVAQLSRIPKDFFDRPSLEKLITDRDFDRAFFTHFS